MILFAMMLAALMLIKYPLLTHFIQAQGFIHFRPNFGLNVFSLMLLLLLYYSNYLYKKKKNFYLNLLGYTFSILLEWFSEGMNDILVCPASSLYYSKNLTILIESKHKVIGLHFDQYNYLKWFIWFFTSNIIHLVTVGWYNFARIIIGFIGFSVCSTWFRFLVWAQISVIQNFCTVCD